VSILSSFQTGKVLC